MEERRRICRVGSSPERGKGCVPEASLVRPRFKKVQIVYYLSRNGHLEHPHYMELTHLAHQHLRLKDVMDRLTVLRGKAMPSLYSWSCKRSYKNGYVWNDLGENDVIYPSEGAEYVLKGSELMEGPQHILQQAPNLQPKRKSVASKRHSQPEEILNSSCQNGEITHQENADDDEEEEEHDDKTRLHESSTRGLDAFKQTAVVQKNEYPSELTIPDGGGGANAASSSPPSATSSTGGRSAEEDPIGIEPLLSRNSMLLSLIACGGSASFRKAPPPCTPPRRSGGDLRREAVRRAAATEDEAAAMIGCMSENPRFGGLAVEEKEYFSGSIVEAMANDRVDAVEAGLLKKSASHNQERSKMAEIGEVGAKEVGLDDDKCLIGKCIPIKKSSSKQPKK